MSGCFLGFSYSLRRAIPFRLLLPMYLCMAAAGHGVAAGAGGHPVLHQSGAQRFAGGTLHRQIGRAHV